MKEAELRELYQRAMARRSDAARHGCAAPEALAAVAEGRAAEAERLVVLEHVGQCPACRGELDLLRAAVTAGRLPHRWRVAPLALAASLAILVGAGVLVRGWWAGRATGDVMRGPGEVALVAPRGDLATAAGLAFVWRAVPGATRYHVELLDESGALLFTASTTDTTLAIPPPTPLLPAREYHWWVRATRSDGTQVRSLAERFRLQTP